ncbi:hypothetical protein Tco_0670965 [Tanacetum coccineum]
MAAVGWSWWCRDEGDGGSDGGGGGSVVVWWQWLLPRLMEKMGVRWCSDDDDDGVGGEGGGCGRSLARIRRRLREAAPKNERRGGVSGKAKKLSELSFYIKLL